MRRRGSRVLVLAAVTMLSACGGASAGADGDRGSVVRVAAASDLRFAMEELIAAFAGEDPGVEVLASYGSSGTFFAQLRNEAPFDVYLSADRSYPERLEEEGLTLPESTFSYAVGRLVLWVREDSPIEVEGLGMDALLDPSVRKIAIADPEHAPYGRAAVAALEAFGVYGRVEDRLVLGESVAQAAQFAQSGGAQIGIVALSLALAPDLEGRFWEIPRDRYPTIDQGGAIMRWAEDPGAAGAFVDFLVGAEGREILARFGFAEPG